MNKKGTGIIRTNAKGFGFIDLEDDKSIFFPPNTLGSALDGDTVAYDITRKSRKDREGFEGQVTKIVERRTELFVGTLVPAPRGYVIMPDNKKFYITFFLRKEVALDFAKKENIDPKEFEKTLGAGVKVQVKLRSWAKDSMSPEVELYKVIGKKGENNAEMESIVLNSGFEIGFPKAVEKEAEKLKLESSKQIEKELKTRRDFRNIWTCTIDPEDAKDFDDAISFRTAEEFAPGDANMKGYYEIGVHIADVSAYVTPHSELDTEALKRGCSIYLVDRTIPMLPEILSNDLCSLNPNEEKLTFSAVFIINEKCHVKDSWYGRTVIKSAKRFTYESAQATLTGQVVDGKVKDSDPKNHERLVILNNIAKKLRSDKLKNGAIEFEKDEIKFKLDKNGFPIGVYKKSRFDAHKLVEEFMLLANKGVAKFIYDNAKKINPLTKSLYRIHDSPDPERITDVAEFIKSLGHSLHVEDGEVSPLEINRLLASIDGRPEADVIRTSIIRSMSKAIYSTKNIGHFGLGFSHYTHFTSPIRRYPDLAIHRLLEKTIKKEKLTERELNALEHIADQSTNREITASEAERDSIKYKQVEYMMDKVGKQFNGIVSGVTEWGLYIEENETKCEGLIHISKLSTSGDEFFKLDRKNACLVSERTAKKFTIGDKVRFEVVSADLDKKTLDYKLI